MNVPFIHLRCCRVWDCVGGPDLSRQSESPVAVIDPIDFIDPDNAGTFNPVDALPTSSKPHEQPIGLRKRAWSFGRMLLPYDKQ